MTNSLRLRLFLIILVPLALLAMAVGAWRITIAQQTAEEFFDRNLMLTALAVARDVALSDGDAISLETQAFLGETAGGPVRYHVYGPDGVLVIGYAVPPVPLSRKMPPDQTFAYYDATYRGVPARVLRLKDETTIAGMTGTYTVTVWQDLEARNAFVMQLALRSAAIILTLLVAVALLVWFGVRLGLKPLLELEDAISRRSSEDLSPIRRRVPVETRGVVGRLNDLFEQVAVTLEAQTNFVSDAAHQLRNPIAGLRALAEATQSSPDLDTARARASELAQAAAETGGLANRLLTLERVRAEMGAAVRNNVALGPLVDETVRAAEAAHAGAGVDIGLARPKGELFIPGDALMLREALMNLIDNAYVHGGDGLSRINVALRHEGANWILTVANDGRSVAAETIPKILSRFGQGEAGRGSGLGLSIAEAVARRHGGELSVLQPASGFAVRVTLPEAVN